MLWCAESSFIVFHPLTPTQQELLPKLQNHKLHSLSIHYLGSCKCTQVSVLMRIQSGTDKHQNKYVKMLRCDDEL